MPEHHGLLVCGIRISPLFARRSTTDGRRVGRSSFAQKRKWLLQPQPAVKPFDALADRVVQIPSLPPR